MDNCRHLVTPHRAKRNIFILGLILVLLSGCAGAPVESAPTWPTTGWQLSEPGEQGLNAEMLEDMLDTIRENGYDINSVSIVRNGFLVMDEYFPPFTRESTHIIHSCTKSIVSALIGIAIDQGYIKSVDQPVLELLPDRDVANLDARKEAMTLEDLLTMSTGLDCQDSYLYNWRGLRQMRASDDWAQHMLDLPVVDEPGTRFEYCNGGSYLLATILQQATGVTALEFARQRLFSPLGIEAVEWPASPQGVNIGWGEMHLRPQDMAKIGNLYLNQGRWDGEQILPSDWVEASTRGQIAAGTLSDEYGYQWWVDAAGYDMALGYAGQYIIVVPEHDLVVVFTSQLESDQFFTPETLFKEYILPAIEP